MWRNHHWPQMYLYRLGIGWVLWCVDRKVIDEKQQVTMEDPDSVGPGFPNRIVANLLLDHIDVMFLVQPQVPRASAQVMLLTRIHSHRAGGWRLFILYISVIFIAMTWLKCFGWLSYIPRSASRVGPLGVEGVIQEVEGREPSGLMSGAIVCMDSQMALPPLLLLKRMHHLQQCVVESLGWVALRVVWRCLWMADAW